MPGLGPGINLCWLRELKCSAATLGFPNARTGAVGVAAPGPGAACRRKATLANRALVAGADVDDDGAVLGDLAGDVNGRGAAIGEAAVGDRAIKPKNQPLHHVDQLATFADQLGAMAAGTYTIRVQKGATEKSRVVAVPPGPGTDYNIEL